MILMCQRTHPLSNVRRILSNVTRKQHLHPKSNPNYCRLRTKTHYICNQIPCRHTVRILFVGKHPILQITPEEESLGLKSGIWGARSNF